MDQPEITPRLSSVDKIARMQRVTAERNQARQSATAAAPVVCAPPVAQVITSRAVKCDRGPGAVVRHEVQDGHMDICGVATARDYDIVLMAIADLTERVNEWREGKGLKPGPDFSAHVADVLKCCRYERGEDTEGILTALRRLASTSVVFEQTRQVRNKRLMRTEGENLIARFKVVENVVTGDITSIELRVADWIYREIIEGKIPRVQNLQRVLPSAGQE